MEPAEALNIRFHHFHAPGTGRLIATIATQPDSVVGFIRVAAAICSKRDSPTRKMGREIALGRLLKGQGNDIRFVALEDIRGLIASRRILGLFPRGEKLKARPPRPYEARVARVEKVVTLIDQFPEDLPF